METIRLLSELFSPNPQFGAVMPLLAALLAVNLTAFALFGIDKYKARHGLWRISEKTLFLFALIGGTPGAWMGMKFFHHKTRHRRFRCGLPLIFLVQLLLCFGFIFWIRRSFYA